MNQNNQKLWVAAEVAQYLRVAPSTIYAWVAADKIPHIKVNGVIRFLQEELEQWLHTHSRSGSRPHPAPTTFKETAPPHRSSSIALREAGQRAIQQNLASLSPSTRRPIMMHGKTAHQKGGSDGRV
jgi:excisionase family DNA binding protein